MHLSRRRFLFTCWPFVGHVLPQMSIAVALRDAGHEVAFYTGGSARRTIEPEGFTVYPFRAVDEDAAYAHMQVLETSPGTGRANLRLVQRTLREWLVETIPGQLADLVPVLEEWKPDVVITDLSLWSTIVVLWERVPVPVVLSSTFMGPLVPGPDAPPFGFGAKPPRSAGARLVTRLVTGAVDLAAAGVRTRVDELRAQHGLGPLGCSVNAFTGRLPLYLVGTLPRLDYGRTDLPPSVHYVGPCVWNPPSAETQAWLAEVPRGRPWVHVTESTLRHGDPFILKAAAQGLGGRPFEVIMTSGAHRSPEDLGLGPLASNVRIVPWLNHRELMPSCAAVVTTGGTGTVMAALQAGVPMVVVPTTWDKPDNARRLVEAGVAVRLSPRRCTPASLRAAVEAVLEERRYRDAAGSVADELAAAPGPAGAASLLADLAGRVAAR